MSSLRDVLSDVIADRQSFTGDQLVNLRTGKTFTAEVEEIQDIELNTELGRDAREAVLIHVQDIGAAADQNMGDRLLLTLSGVQSILQIVRRKDNPGSVQTEFGCKKIVDATDS